jgi:Protein of unknown function (DUF3606)
MPDPHHASEGAIHAEAFRMAKAKKQTSRGRKQDRARVAGGQDYEVRYEAKKTRRSSAAVKKAVKKVGNSRKRIERRFGRWATAEKRRGKHEEDCSGGSVRR